MQTIHATCLHTPEQLMDELRCMTADEAITLGQFIYLARCGGLDDAEEASRVLGRAVTEEQLARELNAIQRVHEIVQPMIDAHPAAQASVVEALSPEWVADLVCGAARALPSLRWEDALWRVPLCRLLHIRLAGYRAAGGVTARPDDKEEAFKALEQLQGMKDNG